MKSLIVKLESIKMTNFKNIEKSEISFCDKGQVLNTIGIYGQNGSGKTAVIEAVNIFKTLLMDIPFQKDLYYYINILSDSSILEYKLLLINDTEEYTIKYMIKLEKGLSFNINTNGEETCALLTREKIEIYDAPGKLLAFIDFKKENKKYSNTYQDYTLDNSDDIISNDIAIATSHVSMQLSKTMIFQQLFRESIKKSTLLKTVLNGLNYYATNDLFVIGTKETSLITAIDNLPLCCSFIDNKNNTLYGTNFISLFTPSTIPNVLIDRLLKELDQINLVIGKLIPGIKIGYKKLSDGLDKFGNDTMTIQLVSIIGESQIPLKYESEGVKKLIAICSLLIRMYNNESVCVVIDELDSGIFEYLLGELVKILYNDAKGQLIFTSHNLRLLEVLPKQCIVFSTINPQKCFVKMANVKPNHNLRDFYYRTILLGGQKEELYDETEDYEIERALRKCQSQS